MSTAEDLSSSVRSAFRRLLDACLPPDSWREQRWVGWVLIGSVILLLLFVLFTVVVLLVLIETLARHGAGTLGGQAAYAVNGPHDFNRGFSIARWWLFGLLSIVPISLLRVWWHFVRGSRPSSVHADLDAAQAGDPGAALRLGLHYRDRDPGSARAWLSRAAHAGAPEAMVALAQDLREGRGGPRDLASARGWLLRASAAGHPEAANLLVLVDAQLGDRHSDRGV